MFAALALIVTVIWATVTVSGENTAVARSVEAPQQSGPQGFSILR